MLTIAGAPDSVEALYQRCKTRSLALAARLGGEPLRVPGNTDLLDVADPGDWIFVEDGYLRLRMEGMDVRLYSEGDIVPPRVAVNDFSLTSEFASNVVVLSKEALLSRLSADPSLLAEWLEVEALATEVDLSLCASLSKAPADAPFELRSAKAGEVIIAEGDAPEEIYELVEGAAQVSRDGHPLAEIHSGEIFGEVGFLTRQPRTATVTATRRCLLRVVGRADFEEALVRSPGLVIAIARTLATRLVTMNERVG